jgi:hypothetical protein
VTGRADDEQVLTDHRAAVRACLGDDAKHAAQTAHWLADQADYATLPAELVDRIHKAAEILEAVAEAVTGRLEAEREQLGLDRATYQRQLERGDQGPS